MDNTIFLPDHSDPLKRPLLECNADGTIIRYYIWGNERLLGFIDTNNTLTVAHCDEQGNVIALTASNGSVLFTANYSPHGEDWGTTGFNPTPFTWLGGYGVQSISDSSFGSLYLTRHRAYSSRLNRFLSSDPLGLNGGLNLYAYGEGNPLMYIDPLGLCSVSANSSSFLGNMVTGATQGDFAQDTGWGGVVGQVGTGLIPIYGQIADARDITANTINVWNDPKDVSAWVGLAASVVAIIPGIGDAAKGLYKGSSEFAVNTTKNAGDLISGSLKRSPSYHSELANKSYAEIVTLSKGQGELANKATQMKKLIEQNKRLMEKQIK